MKKHNWIVDGILRLFVYKVIIYLAHFISNYTETFTQNGKHIE